MSDIFKLFRRQRSVKQTNNEESSRSQESVSINNFGEEQTLNASYIPVRNMSVSSEYCSSSIVINEAKQNQGFKEPKGWRKSLRKLKLKKQSQAISVSSDNIAKISPYSSAPKQNKTADQEDVSSACKRWSYSPDLSEDNVPGARELRGTLERNLSVKKEEDEIEHLAKYRQQQQYQHHISQNELERSRSSTYSHNPDNRLDNTTLSTFQSDESSVMETHAQLGRSHSTPNANSHLQNPFRDQTWPALSPEEWKATSFKNMSDSTMNTDPAYTTSMSNQSFSSMQPSTSGRSTSAGSETPDEGNNPQHLEDIDEALDGSHTFMLDSLHGQQGKFVQHDGDTLRMLTSSLLRGRAATEYERDAEYVLENLEYQPERLEAAASTCSWKGETSDDNVSWDSSEFDSDSDQSINELKKNKEKKNRKSGKIKESDRDVPKKRFWDRSALKKKLSVKSVSDVEPSLFVDLLIPADRSVPQLPSLLPFGLTENQVKRRNIVSTILTSEQSYIESLQRLETEYKQALLDNKIVGSDVIEKIFHKISAILQCHRLFQMALSVAASAWDKNEEIGGTFVASFSKSMVLECYGDFINNFTVAMDTVRKTCLRKPQFLAFLRDRQSESKDRLNLYGLMLKPVQRFPQFILLVQDLLKHTPIDHRDRLQLQLALTELETLADRLNQRKALDEDAADFRSLLENSNIKLGGHTKDGRVRMLVKQGDVRECEYNEDGLLEKVKDCLLVLTNDLLLCCAINNSFVHMNGFERRVSLNQPSNTIYDAFHHTVRQISTSIRKPHQRGVASTYKDMYKLKWRVNLDEVEVFDGSGRNSNHNEREALHADFITMQEISRQVEKLQLNHEGISSEVVNRCLSNLQTKIRQAEQVATQPDDASFNVKFPGKSDSTVSRTLVLAYNSQKEEWLDAISKSKLANDPSNLDGWFSSDGSDVEVVWGTPLFLRSLSAHMSYQSLQVQSAHSFMPSTDVTLLWLSCSASTVLSVVSVYYITEERVEKVHVMQVESSVHCMEHWCPDGSSTSVWLGMESGCLLEYSGDGSYRKLSEVSTPTMSTVMIMKAHASFLFVGLLDGTLAMYTRQTGNASLDHVSSIVVGSGPLLCLSPEQYKLWGCSGNNVVTIDVEKFRIESSRSLLMDGEELVVSLVTRVGRGLWVTFTKECTLYLYHLDSLQRLQEINLFRVIRDFVQSLDSSEAITEACHITSLCSSHSQLYVGTSIGLLLAMPLPKLPDSIPMITGPCKVSRHAVSGPLSFLFAPQLPKLRSFTPSPSSDEPPPLPRRDDLDDTLIPPPTNDDDKRSTLTSSTLDFPPPPDSPPTYREEPPPPYVRDPPISPRRPSKLSLRKLSERYESSRTQTMILSPESGSVYQRMQLESLESPRTAAFVKWNKNTTRSCPLLLACGEGYRNYGGKPTKQGATDHSPSVICWKVNA